MKPNKRVLVWGTFDLLHAGHKLFLQEALRHGRDLHVVVVPDEIVLENKGRRPFLSQSDRRRIVGSLPFVKSATIDSISRGLPTIKKVSPDFFCIGEDQSEKATRLLEQKIQKLRLPTKIIRLPLSFSSTTAPIHTSELAETPSKSQQHLDS